jgi:hypothetical protein
MLDNLSASFCPKVKVSLETFLDDIFFEVMMEHYYLLLDVIKKAPFRGLIIYFIRRVWLHRGVDLIELDLLL